MSSCINPSSESASMFNFELSGPSGSLLASLEHKGARYTKIIEEFLGGIVG